MAAIFCSRVEHLVSGHGRGDRPNIRRTGKYYRRRGTLADRELPTIDAPREHATCRRSPGVAGALGRTIARRKLGGNGGWLTRVSRGDTGVLVGAFDLCDARWKDDRRKMGRAHRGGT